MVGRFVNPKLDVAAFIFDEGGLRQIGNRGRLHGCRHVLPESLRQRPGEVLRPAVSTDLSCDRPGIGSGAFRVYSET